MGGSEHGTGAAPPPRRVLVPYGSQAPSAPVLEVGKKAASLGTDPPDSESLQAFCWLPLGSSCPGRKQPLPLPHARPTSNSPVKASDTRIGTGIRGHGEPKGRGGEGKKGARKGQATITWACPDRALGHSCGGRSQGQTARVSCPAPSLGEAHGPRKGDGPSAPEGSPATQVLASWPSLAYHAVRRGQNRGTWLRISISVAVQKENKTYTWAPL